MADEFRDTGIAIIGSVPWGTHFCQFYKTRQDLIDILIPYFKAGLENNEFCMWITSEPLAVAEAQQAMRKAVTDFDKYLQRGQIEIIPYTEWYLLDGTFDDERVLAGWVSKLEQALARGYSGLRLTGNTFWLEKNHWQDFTDYEARVNDVLGKYQMLALCTYSLDKCDSSAVIDVVKNHQFALVKQEGEWEIIENAAYKKTKEALNNALAELQKRSREASALLAGSQAILMHREFKSAARTIFDSCKNTIGATGGYVALLSKEGVDNEVLFLESGGRPCSVDPTLPMPIRGLRGEVYRTGKAAYDNTFAESEWTAFMPAGHVPLDNVLFAPLVLEDRVVGLLGLANKPGGFTQNDAEMATAFGRLAAIALSNSRMLESLEESEKTVLREKEALQVIMDNTGAQLAYLDSDFNFIKVNTAYARGSGRAEAELIGKNHFVIFPSEENRAIFERVRATGQPVVYHDKPFEFLDQPERGITYWDWTLAPVKDDSGQVQGLVLSLVDTTERVRAEERIRQAAQQWQETFDAIPDLISIHDRNYQIVRVNRALSRAYGMTPEQLVGKSCYQIFHQSGQPIENCPHQQTLRTGQPTKAEFFESSQDAYLDVSTAPIVDASGEITGSVHIARDITERKRIENELKVKDHAVASAISGIAITDLNGRLTYANPACLNLWNYERDKVIGKHSSIFFADKGEGESALKAILEKGAWQGELKAKRNDGSTFDVQVSANLVTDAGGEPFCMMASFVDITERKRIEQIKDEFIGLVSHELRTPLTVINGCLSTVVTEWENLQPVEIQQLLRDAILESETLSHLLENLLELSRFQAERLVLYEEPTNIQTLVKETLTKIKRQAPSHRFTTSLPDRLPPLVIDPLRIERILYNLLDNAAKYSRPGTYIRVSARAEPEHLVISVSDHGRGLSPTEQARLFSPFQRLENGRPDRTRGAGLGLLVCRRLVEAHGGEIWVESKEGKGSTFFFTLPYEQTPDTSKTSRKTKR